MKNYLCVNFRLCVFSICTLLFTLPVHGQQHSDRPKRAPNVGHPSHIGANPPGIVNESGNKAGKERGGGRYKKVLSQLSSNLNAGELRTVNAAGNNVENPTWGSADSPFLRLSCHNYKIGQNRSLTQN